MTDRLPVEESTTSLLTTLSAAPVLLSTGDVLLKEGDTSGRMYRVEKGSLEVFRTDEDGVEFRMAVVGVGELLGDMSMLEGKPHVATVRALEDCILIGITREAWEAMLEEEQPTPQSQLMRKVARNLTRALTRQADETLASMKRELELSKLRAATSTFLVHMLLGFAAYAVVMKWMSENTGPLANATVVTGPLMLGMAAVAISYARRSGFPMSGFGLTWQGAGRNALEATMLTLPVLLILVAGKYLLLTFDPAYEQHRLIPLLHEPFSVGPAIGYLVYAALVPLQEFLSRGAIQGTLFDVLDGSERRRKFWSILVSNTLFAITHLHLTITYGVAAFVGGLFWGWLYSQERSLVRPVVSHIIVGVFALYVLDFADLFKGIG